MLFSSNGLRPGPQMEENELASHQAAAAALAREAGPGRFHSREDAQERGPTSELTEQFPTATPGALRAGGAVREDES